MIILDTSFLFAYFQSTDVHHNKALEYAENLDNEKILLPYDILKELITVITYKISSEEALKVLDALTIKDSPIELLHIDEIMNEQSLKLFKELSPHKFSFIDVLLIYLSRTFNSEILTFDKALLEQVSTNN